MKNNTNNKIIIILCTFPQNTKTISQLIDILLYKKLAACISILHDTQTFYYWDNKKVNNTETQLLIKTTYSLKNKIFKNIKKLHPYKIPELLVLPVLNGEKNYLSWIIKSTLKT